MGEGGAGGNGDEEIKVGYVQPFTLVQLFQEIGCFVGASQCQNGELEVGWGEPHLLARSHKYLGSL